jgi:hypothetical protein
MKGKKSVPNLPGSSRMQMPSGSGSSVKKIAPKGGATKSVMSMGKSKGVLGSKSSVKQKGKY